MQINTIHLITGGSGFVGTHLALHLVAQGYKVRILDLLKPSEILKNSSIEFVQGDILDDYALETALLDVSVVHHLAARVPIHGIDSEFEKINHQGTLNLVLNLNNSKTVQHLIYSSSSAVYGGRGEIDDNTVPNPIESYGQSKLNAERCIEKMLNKNIRYNIIRSKTILGKNRLGLFSLLFNWINCNQPIVLIGNGANIIQFIGVNDYCRIHLWLIENNTKKIINAGSDSYCTLIEALNNLIHLKNSNSRILKTPKKFIIFVLKTLDFLQLSPLKKWHYLTYGESFYFKNKFTQDFEYTESTEEILKVTFESYLNQIYNSTPQSAHQSILDGKILKFILKILSFLNR